jgi:pyruvate/2-oxoglutarate/acetoin dehydrogenase E1 component
VTGVAPARVGEVLNRSLHELFDSDPRIVLLGEDIVDPYGGAFGVTRGLSLRHPERVIGTPISEGAIVGVAGGLAMGGDRVIVELMFGDFVTLCFDPIVNFISKSVSMYGRRRPMPVVVRCPVGGNRGYGPTHSQSPQKHLLGVPNLRLYELSALHNPRRIFEEIFDSGDPAVFFEDKVLYTQPATLDAFFLAAPVGEDDNWVRVSVEDGPPDWAIITSGGLVPRALAAVREALVTAEVSAELFVPARLFPLDLEPLLPRLAAARRILVVEDGPAGGGWAGEVARQLYELLWGRLRHPITVLQPECAVIPAAPHLERRLLIQAETIRHTLIGAGRG